VAREWKRWPREVEASLTPVEIIEICEFIHFENENEKKAWDEARRK
jgi:hypothetical protein